ncbi:MAG: hypothetical protein R2873_33605 [Caldilineaceae bacterium]
MVTNKTFARLSKPVEAQEMLEDIRAYDDAKARIEAGEELIPSRVSYALLDGKIQLRLARISGADTTTTGRKGWDQQTVSVIT